MVHIAKQLSYKLKIVFVEEKPHKTYRTRMDEVETQPEAAAKHKRDVGRSRIK